MRTAAAAVSLLILAAAVGAERPPFRLPEGFEGTWRGVPYISALGTWSHNMTFAISRADNGDYLWVTNLKYDADLQFAKYWSWQRSYLKAEGNWSGNILHCPGPRSPFLERQAMMQVHTVPGPADRSVTFCLQKWAGYDELNHPFPFTSLRCWDEGEGPGCGCFNWTLTLNKAGTEMDYQVSFAHSLGWARTQHLFNRMRRIGGPPPVDIQMPGANGSEFVCDYGGRDSTIMDGGDIAAHAACPFAAAPLPLPAGKAPHVMPPAWLQVQSPYENCYVLNEETGLVLEWDLNAAASTLRLRVSAVAAFGDETYVAIGFRPLGGASTAWARDHGTGRERRFGMAGADIVLGHGRGGLLQMHALEYTGPPVPDSSLVISDAQVSFSNGRVSLEFVRPLVGGRLHALFGSNASIASSLSDMLWAVGHYDVTSGFPTNHGSRRGWREVNWTDPEYDARPLLSLRPYRCVPPQILLP